jgi:hypothetical protein
MTATTVLLYSALMNVNVLHEFKPMRSKYSHEFFITQIQLGNYIHENRD